MRKIFLIIGILLGTSQIASAATISGISAYAFNQSIGMNLHLDRADGQWKNYPLIEAMLERLQIHLIREGILTLSDPKIAAFIQKLDKQDKPGSIRSDLIVDPSITTAQQIRNLLNVWGVSFLEGPNECDISCNAPSWVASDLATLAAIDAALPTWPGIDAIAPSVAMSDPALLGDISAKVKHGNPHDYTGSRPPETHGWGGLVYGQPYGSEAYNVAAAQRSAIGKPVISTESGYSTESLSQATQASYIERRALQCSQMLEKCILYALVDDSQQFGLVDLDGNMKLSAFGLSGLMNIINDSVPLPGACSLQVSITSSKPILSYVYCKTNGEIDLALVDPEQLQDPDTLAPMTFTPATVTVSVSLGGLTRMYSQTPDYHWLEQDSPNLVGFCVNERPVILAFNAGPVVTPPLLP